MRVGITGASGLIGTHLVDALRERGDEVVRFVRPSTKPSGEKSIRWDPSRGLIDEGDLEHVGGFDAVIHLAGAGIGDKRWNKKRKAEILSSRVDSTNLLTAALLTLKSGTPHLLSGSAIGFYGSRGDEVLSEQSTHGAGFLSEICTAWEAATAPLEEGGANVTHLRTGIVMTKFGGALKKQLPFFAFGVGGKLASGEQWISPISLVDEIRSILWTLDQKISGPVNLVCPSPCTNYELTKALGKILNRPTLLPVPRFALEIILGAEMAHEVVLSSTKVLPDRLTESGFTFRQNTISEIFKAAL